MQRAGDTEAEKALAPILDLFSGLGINSCASLVRQEQPQRCVPAPSRLQLCLLSPDILQRLLTDSCTAGPGKWAGAESLSARTSPGPSHSSESGCQFTPLLETQTEWVMPLNGAADALTCLQTPA